MNEKLEKFKKGLPDLVKKYGDQLLDTSSLKRNYDIISSGSFGLDEALGIGGYPKGRIVELIGPESSGKSTICLHAIAECQKAGGLAAYIDTEHAFDPTYAEAIGVNIVDLVFSQPDSAEDALNIANDLLTTGNFDLIVYDSISAAPPKAELEGEIGDSKMGAVARLMSQALRKIVPNAARSNCCMIWVSQIRLKIGLMFGNPQTTNGGEAMKFAASIRMEVGKTPLKDGDEFYGNKTKVKVIKNKCAPPFRIAEFDVLYGVGIDKLSEILNKAIALNIVNKGGAWLTYKDNKIQGLDKFRQLMEDNQELTKEIEEQIHATKG